MRVPFLVVAAAVSVQGLLHNSDVAQKPLLITDGLDVDIALEAQSPASCVACEAILLQLKLLALQGDDLFVAAVTEACRRLKVVDDDICEGSVALEGPIVAHSLRGLNIGSKTSRLACVQILGSCSFPEVEEHKVSFPSPKPKRRRPEPSGKKPLQVVHYSDIHVDPWYTEGAEANCTKFVCCRNYTDGPAPDNSTRPAGPHGDHTCDSPEYLEQSMYTAIQTLVADAIFSIFTGDIVDHAVWNTTVTQNTKDVTASYGRMAAAGMKVYATAGNHETSPTNSYPPSGVSSSAQWLYDVLSSSWTRWVGTRAADITREFGAYSTKYPKGNLRVISLNTNLYYTLNFWLYEEPMERDPSGQFQWLISELDAAERAGERVYILGHMAFGVFDAFHDASNYFDQIVNRYEATIAAMFFGHTHRDEFQTSYSDYSQRTSENAVAVSYIAPSLVPKSGEPAFRVYDIDPVTFGVLDITTYIANMSDPRFQSAEGPIWTKYYSARESYGAVVDPPLAPLEALQTVGQGNQEMDPAFWHEVTEVFEKNPFVFEEFMERKSRGWQVSECDGDCKTKEICKLRAGRAQDNCVLPGVYVQGNKKQKKETEKEKEECGGSVLVDTLRTLAGDVVMRGWLTELIDGDVSLR